MKFTAALASLSIALLPLVSAVDVTFDPTYDNAGGSTLTVSCSDGSNGLAGRFPTFGSLPGFPNIGGAVAVEGFNSANCGTCWQLTSINVVAIDHASPGFNIAEGAMNTLTGGQAEQLGRISATATQVSASACGL
ncbi:Asp f 13-like protein [Infundibulicybe gibba]|nr:Asp f 13-like protein [Infundibulicybe gibba]